MGTWDQSTDNLVNPTIGPLWSQEYGTDVWRSPDGINWTFVSKVGLGDGNNTGSRSFASTPYGLFMGTARNYGGTEVFNVDNSIIDFNRDGVIDQKDVNMTIARLNTKAKVKDPMDIDQDGMITQADVDLLKTQCTYPQCASPKVKPATSTLTPPLVHSVPVAECGASTVCITWGAVSGASEYLVYRITVSPSENVPPPAGPAADACGKPNAPTICTMLPQVPSPATTALFGYPSAPELLGSVTNLSYGPVPAPNYLQTLYFVVAEDSVGNLSSPSNVVGGPTLALQ
jgi:hypothetical protein